MSCGLRIGIASGRIIPKCAYHMSHFGKLISTGLASYSSGETYPTVPLYDGIKPWACSEELVQEFPKSDLEVYHPLPKDLCKGINR